MKRFVRVLLPLLAAALILAGCALSPIERHAAAIEQAVLSFTDCYFELDGLRAQLKAQSGPLTGYESELAYTLDIRIPDYGAIPISDVPLTRPAPDFAAMDFDAFVSALRQAAYAAVQGYAETHSFPATVNAQIDVTLTRTDGAWQAAFTPESRAALTARLDGMLAERAEALCENPPEARLYEVAAQGEHILGLVFEGEGLYRACTLKQVRALGDDRFAVDIACPDPEESFALLADLLFASYVAPVFTEPRLRLTADRGDADALAALPKLDATITVYCAPGSAAALEDDAGLWNAFYKAKLAAERSLNARVRKKWFVPEQPRPQTGVLTGTSKGNSMSFDGTGMPTDVYLGIYTLTDKNIYSEGTLYLTAYMRKDEKLNFKLPTGNYKMLELYGTTWYGQTHQFGDKGQLFLFGDVLESRSGYTFILRFHAEEGGNVSSLPME